VVALKQNKPEDLGRVKKEIVMILEPFAKDKLMASMDNR
jgi:hypothetical protein